MFHGFTCQRHDTVICCNNQHHYVRDCIPSCLHLTESRMTGLSRKVKEAPDFMLTSKAPSFCVIPHAFFAANEVSRRASSSDVFQ
ncbi:hypothetical protein Mapa_006804 [Marchantia paleacea]|nr:hypothetical protein Mapa_006804 [Marchantia paleacea]